MARLWISGAWVLWVGVAVSAYDGQTTAARPDLSGQWNSYKLDGSETAEVISVNGCVNRTRITKAAASRDTVTITTWMVVKSSCVHGEVDDEPLVSGPGPIEVREVRGRRKLESITLLSRQGSALTVDSTRSGPDGPVSASTTYRR
jgi:hypothetical protein